MRAERLTPVIALLALCVVLVGCVSVDSGAGPSAKAWPVSSSGRPSFYYFGSGS